MWISFYHLVKQTEVTRAMRMTEAEKRAHRVKQQVAAVALLSSGKATTAEVARLLRSSRQRVQNWVQARDLDVKKARATLLKKQWKAAWEKVQ
jgi:hypothetical protein